MLAYTIFTTETFDGWFSGLRDRTAQRRIQARIDRMEDGNLGDCLEIIVLLCGGSKSSQKRDSRAALELAAALEKE